VSAAREPVIDASPALRDAATTSRRVRVVGARCGASDGGGPAGAFPGA
jgi:hypothetical protein